MAALNFTPDSPSNGDTFTANGVTYTYDGTKWKTSIVSNDFFPNTGGTVSGNIVLDGELQHSGDTDTNIAFDTDTILFDTAGSERFRVGSAGQLGIGGATYGTSGQALLSGGASAAPSWGDVGGASWNTGTSVSPTGVSEVNFDSIPSNARVIYITLFGISWTTASGYLAFRLRTGSGTTVTSGYLTTSTYLAHAAAVNVGNNSHALQCNVIQSAGANINATVRIINVTGNTWSMEAVFNDESSGHMIIASGHIPLSAALTGVNVYQTGSNNFDDGTIQIHYITD